MLFTYIISHFSGLALHYIHLPLTQQCHTRGLAQVLCDGKDFRPLLHHYREDRRRYGGPLLSFVTCDQFLVMGCN